MTARNHALRILVTPARARATRYETNSNPSKRNGARIMTHYCNECGRWAELDAVTARCFDCIGIWQTRRQAIVLADRNDNYANGSLT